MDAIVSRKPLSVATLYLHPGCDSGGVMRAALTSDELCHKQPEAVLFTWLLALPAGVEPAAAAGALLHAYPAHPAFRGGHFQARVLRLLGEISEWPPERLRERRGIRRGGRRRSR